VDEKTHVQALNRIQPVLPIGLGYVDGVIHDNVRHGTTTLFAAMDVATGTVIRSSTHPCAILMPTCLRSSTSIFIRDNYATHKHTKVEFWLAARPWYHVHDAPTYASWLYQVARWFRRISRPVIRRSSFHSVQDLVAKIDHCV
jgi:putative transposase